MVMHGWRKDAANPGPDRRVGQCPTASTSADALTTDQPQFAVHRKRVVRLDLLIL